MTSARWQNRKPQTLLPPWRHKFNNTQTSSHCKKSRNRLRASCPPSMCKTSCIKVGKFITLTHQSPFPWHTIIWSGENSQLLAYLWGGKEKTGTYAQCSDFSGAARGTGFCLAWILALIAKGTRLGAAKNKGNEWIHTHLPLPLPAARCRISGRKPPTPGFSPRRERVGTCVQCFSFSGSYPRDWFLYHLFQSPEIWHSLDAWGLLKIKKSWTASCCPRGPAV